MIEVLSRVDRRVSSLQGSAHHALKQAILEGRLKPGEALVEEELCASLGISRAPLREALVRLEQQGLVTTIPYKGKLVARVTEQELRENHQIREVLEVLALDQAWTALTEHDLVALAEEFDRARPLILNSGSAVAHAQAHARTDWALHGLLAQRSGNVQLAQLIQHLHEYGLRAQLDEIVGAAESAVHRQESFAEHLRVLEALQARDRARAEAALRDHIRSAGRRLVDRLRQMQDRR
ncbi:MAG: GntR family transcriptional regulator [Chloroflexi bacterium]|nr:GntR family transcriptional regulator [Chloroflexota bacterium]